MVILHLVQSGRRHLPRLTAGVYDLRAVYRYTTFTYSPKASATEISLAPVHEILAATTAAGRTFPSSKLLADADPLVNYMVNVTNSGTMDADDVVLGFLVPPGAGTSGVPLQTLFGFERVHVKAGAHPVILARVSPY